MAVLTVELGIPYSGWPLRLGGDYAFGTDLVGSEIAAKLEAWARHFNAHFDAETGWDSPGSRAAHLREGVELRRTLEEQLGPDYRVVLDPLGSGLR